jgi:hypothetical protein
MSNEGGLRTGKVWRAGVIPAQHRIMDSSTNRHAEICARWRRDPEAIGGAPRAKRVHA